MGGENELLARKFALSAILVAALVLSAAPIAIALKHSSNLAATSEPDEKDDDNETISVTGTVTAFLYDDDNETDQEHDDTNAADQDHDGQSVTEEEHEYDADDVERVCAFVIDNSTVVEFGPWWYWMNQSVNITSVIHVGDIVNVTGELEDEDNMTVLEAWHIDNLTTGAELTIKEEGRPLWAGGPKGLGIVPWPPSDEDD